MAFNPGEMLVFNRAGTRIGVLTKWSVTAPRSYRLGGIEDFEFHIPLADELGVTIVDTALDALLADDNLIYFENEMAGLAGWGGEIQSHEYGDERVTVRCLGVTSLLSALQTDSVVTQTGGNASNMAARLVAAANTKKGAHGDAQLQFVIDGDAPLYGTYSHDGDLYDGITSLANDTLCEFWGESVLGPGGASLSFVIHWDHRRVIDHTAIVISDGTDGALASGDTWLFSGLERLNRIRIRGAPTHLSDFLDYDCIKNVVKDITPEVDYTLPAAGNARRREALDLTVNFGLSDDMQKQIATLGYTDPGSGDHIQGIQENYLGYYKTFLYAYHNRQGKPFLEGYDWSGPDGTNDKRLTERYFRTWNKLGRVHAATVVTTETDGDLPNAVIDEWVLDQTLNPLSGGASGVALDWTDLADHWLADKATGQLVILDNDNVTTTIWGTVAAAGETLLSVATDPGSINQVWVLVTKSGVYWVRSYDIDSHVLISNYRISNASIPNDIAIDYNAGFLYVVGTGDATVHILDLNSGLALTPDPSFPSGGGNCRGISVYGGIAYVIDSAGIVRMLFTADGSLAGTFNSGLSTTAIYTDFTNRRIWIVMSDGSLRIYHAFVAVASLSPGGGITGAPGFDELYSARFVHIVATNDEALAPSRTSAGGSAGTYTVKSGDTLWAIAIRFYGSGSQYPTIYNANKAYLDAITASHGLTPGPHWIFPGEVLTIPNKNSTPPTTSSTTRYFMVWTPGHWEQLTLPGPIGQPDQIQRQWVIDDDQRAGFATNATVHLQNPAVVIVGEEGRVCDWNPTLDGYGILKTSQKWRTKTGHTIDSGHGWYPAEWDVPDRAFEPPPKPYWPEGTAYAADLLDRKNRGLSVQQVHCTNKDGLWSHLELGGVYTVASTTQGPRPGGLSKQVRVIAMSPNELTGLCELVTEENFEGTTAPPPSGPLVGTGGALLVASGGSPTDYLYPSL